MFRRLFHALWDLQERFLLWLWGVRDVGPPDGFFRLRLVAHRGRPVELAGTTVQPGDTVGELHIRSSVFLKLQGDRVSRTVGLGGRPLLEAALRDLAREASEPDGPWREAVAFRGTTMLGLAGRRFGFEAHPLPPGLFSWWLTLYQRLLTARYHPDGLRRVRGGRIRAPRETWISRTCLLDRWASGSEHLGDGHEAQAASPEPLDDAR